MSNLPEFQDYSNTETINGWEVKIYTGPIAAVNMGAHTAIWPHSDDAAVLGTIHNNAAAYCFVGDDCHNNQNWSWFKSENEMRVDLLSTLNELEKEANA